MNLVDQDETSFYFQDEAGQIMRTARTPGLEAEFGQPPMLPGDMPQVPPTTVTPPPEPPKPYGTTVDPALVEEVKAKYGDEMSPVGKMLGERIAEENGAQGPLPTPAAPPVVEPVKEPTEPTEPRKPLETPRHASAMSKAQKDYIKADEKRIEAADKIASIQEQAANETAATLADKANIAAQYELEQKQKEAKREQAMADELGKLELLQKQQRDSKEDPDLFFKEKGDGARVTAVLASVLGSIGSSLLRTENTVQKQLDDIVHRSIAAQRAEMAKKGQAVDFQHNKIAALRQKGFDDRQADAAAYVMGVESILKKLEATIGSNASEEVKARAMDIRAQLEQKIAAAKMQFQQASIPKALSASQQLERNKYLGDRALPFLGPDKFALNEREAKNVSETYQKHQEFLQPVSALKSMLGKYGTQAFGARSADMKQLATVLQLKLKNNEELGTLDKGSQEVLEQLVSDPTALAKGGEKVTRLVSNLEKLSAGKYAASLRRAGLDDDAAQVLNAAGGKIEDDPKGE
jgi:hypothetical protein